MSPLSSKISPIRNCTNYYYQFPIIYNNFFTHFITQLLHKAILFPVDPLFQIFTCLLIESLFFLSNGGELVKNLTNSGENLAISRKNLATFHENLATFFKNLANPKLHKLFQSISLFFCSYFLLISS